MYLSPGAGIKKRKMRTVFAHIVLLLLCAVSLRAQNETPPRKIGIEPFINNLSDTFCLNGGCFVRTAPKKLQPLRLRFCETGFCVTDQSGKEAPFRLYGITVSFCSGTAYTSFFIHANQCGEISRYLYQVKVGSSVSFEAQFREGQSIVHKPCNSLEYKRIK